MNTVELLIESGSLIQARYPIEANCHLMMLLKNKDVIVLFRQNEKLPVNVFRSVRSKVTAVAHTVYGKVYYPSMAS